jgi:hypothetical protein
MEVLKMSIVQTLTEGIVQRDMQKEGQALLNKWGQTGLLEGLTDERQRSSMARLLENQAKELLREANTMAGGDVEGFAAVAFPIVRRVFAGLIANDLVSVQPMSLPSGLIFFLDFTFDRERLGNNLGDSLYGTDKVAKGIADGVTIDGIGADRDRGGYNLNNGYSSPTGSGAGNSVQPDPTDGISATYGAAASTDKAARFDPDFVSGSTEFCTLTVAASKFDQLNLKNVVAINVSSSIGNGILSGTTAGTQEHGRLIRRLTSYDASAGDLTFVFVGNGTDGAATGTPAQLLAAMNIGADLADATWSWPQTDDLTNGGALGSVIGQEVWGLEGNENIPEIDIKVDSIAITAVTKKLKAKWTPELGQDLNAYHNLDAEVELTSILSEQIALEIDREILEDLVKGATAGTFYWSRSPGLFVDRTTGLEIGAQASAPDFTGTVSEWYETLIETINDVSAQIHRKTLRGGANFIVCGPEVANVLEFTAGFRANVTADADKGDIGAVKVGSLSRKFDVMVDPYFPRNVILVGRRGASFLESGYVYAPYVPLQTTPTIFGPEDFVPRKGVMTRYGKKMVRPDMYGLVIVRGLLGESGS